MGTVGEEIRRKREEERSEGEGERRGRGKYRAEDLGMIRYVIAHVICNLVDV